MKKLNKSQQAHDYEVQLRKVRQKYRKQLAEIDEKAKLFEPDEEEDSFSETEEQPTPDVFDFIKNNMGWKDLD